MTIYFSNKPCMHKRRHFFIYWKLFRKVKYFPFLNVSGKVLDVSLTLRTTERLVKYSPFRGNVANGCYQKYSQERKASYCSSSAQKSQHHLKQRMLSHVTSSEQLILVCDAGPPQVGVNSNARFICIYVKAESGEYMLLLWLLLCIIYVQPH